MSVALTGLAAFFAVFLVMPILYELIKKTKAGKEDVLLIFINSAVTYFFLFTILNQDHRPALAWATLALSAVHIAMMLLSRYRLKEDTDLHVVLLSIAMVFLTISLPLFFRTGVLSFAWAAQGVVLAVIGVRYRSLTIRLFGLVALVLSCGNLLFWLPMHITQFRLIFNPSFGVWFSVAAAAYVNHLVYRHASETEDDIYGIISQVLYIVMGMLLILASVMEWYAHCQHNLINTSGYIVFKGLPVIFAAVLMMFVVRPLCPAGIIRKGFAVLITIAGTLCTFVSLAWMYEGSFIFILNKEFFVTALFPSAIVVCHILYRFVYKDISETDDCDGMVTQITYVLTAILLIAIFIAEWYFHCLHNLLDTSEYITVKALPVIFAAALTLLVARPICPTGKIREGFALLIAAAGIIITLISLQWLHVADFTLIANKQLLSVLFFPAALAVCYILYRFVYTDVLETDDDDGMITQVTYVLTTLLLIAISIAEWYFHCRYNLLNTSEYMIIKALPVILTAALMLFIIRPLYPTGKLRETFATLIVTAGIITTLISLAQLHTEQFTMIANKQFLSVMIFPVVLALYHVLYRYVYKDVSNAETNTTRQLYGVTALLTMLIASAEWFFRCRLNQLEMMPAVIIGQVLIFAVSIPFFIARPLSPMGKTSRTISVLLTLVASVFTLVATIFFYQDSFRIFFNLPFIISLAFAASLAVSCLLLYRKDSTGTNYPNLTTFFGLSFVVVLWVLLTEQIYLYWYCLNKYEIMMENWTFQAYMYISIMWALYAAALMIVGFWRRIPILRYVALGLFALLLAKIFFIDTSQIENIYRIAAFIATGAVLVAVSYLYQFLKKKNFFENLTAPAIISEEE